MLHFFLLATLFSVALQRHNSDAEVEAPVSAPAVNNCSHVAHELKLLHPLGAEVIGLDLKKRPADCIVSKLEHDMARNGFLVFKNQQSLEAEDLVRISKYFGSRDLLSRHTVHREAVHEDILRLSNHEHHGIQGVGPQWHNDGSHERSVFSHIAFHPQQMPPTGGETEFTDLSAAYDSLPAHLKDEWSHLASVNAYSGAVHPLVHRHPISKKLVLFLHLGQTGAIIRWPNSVSLTESQKKEWLHLDGMNPSAGPSLLDRGYRVLGAEELIAFFHAYDELLSRPERRATYRYMPGDLVLLDNLAVAHRATRSAHDSNNGVRILHRTTVRGVKKLDPPIDSGLPPFLYIFGENPLCDGGVWQASDYYGAGFHWNVSLTLKN